MCTKQVRFLFFAVRKKRFYPSQRMQLLVKVDSGIEDCILFPSTHKQSFFVHDEHCQRANGAIF